MRAQALGPESLWRCQTHRCVGAPGAWKGGEASGSPLGAGGPSVPAEVRGIARSAGWRAANRGTKDGAVSVIHPRRVREVAAGWELGQPRRCGAETLRGGTPRPSVGRRHTHRTQDPWGGPVFAPRSPA